MISPLPATIASDGTAVFRFAYTTDKPGTLSFSASATSPLPGGSLLIAPAVLTSAIEVTPASVTVNVDTIPPVLECKRSRPATPVGGQGREGSAGFFTITCMATDQEGLSGMKSLLVSCAQGNQETAAGPGPLTASCTYSTKGVHAFLAEATDIAGNVSSVTFPVRLDPHDQAKKK